METAERLRMLVVPLLEGTDAEIYDIEFTGGILKITLDRVGGIDMGVIGRFTRAVSRMIDETDPISSAFTLEVSSPGLERPLRTPAHFARSVGELVIVKARAGVEGERRLKGTLVSSDNNGIELAVEGAEAGQTQRLAFDEIERARTVFEWGPGPKPGGPKAGTKPADSPSSPSAKKKAAKS